MNRNPRILLAAFALVLACIQASAAGRGGFGLRSSCPGDLNSDGFVDDSDFVVFAAAYNELLCAAGEVVLRDSIGEDNTLTNGGRVIPITTGAPAGVTHVAFNVEPSETVTLKEVSMIVGSAVVAPAIDWSAFDYQVRVWSSPAARAAQPQLGDLVNCQFPFPSNFPSNTYSPNQPYFGSAVGAPPFNDPTATHLLTFNLLEDPNVSCAPVILQSGVAYPVAVQPIRPSAASSTIGIITSAETGATDIRYTTSNPAGTPVTNFTPTEAQPVLTGRVGYRVVGVRQ